ncbi:MAG: LytTR family DNA-binding domain-containing protein [Bacteroidota bacterium]
MGSDPIRLVIADDEPPARALIREYLAVLNSDEELAGRLVLVGEATNGDEAVALARSLRPDLLLLDVQMPGGTGFEVLAALAEDEADVLPAVVFSTAFDRYALDAFEVSAVDYLLKPYSAARFAAALRKAVAAVEARRREATSSEPPSSDLERLAQLLQQTQREPASPTRDTWADRLFVRVGARIVPVRTSDVLWIEAAGDYATLHTAEDAYTAGESLGVLADRLDPARFIRVHRSTVIAADALQHLQSDGSGGYRAALTDGTTVRVSRTYAAAVRDRIL